MNNIKEKFNIKKSFKYGLFSSSLIILVIAIWIVINIISSKYYGRVDVTSNKVFSISNQTISILDTVDKDITIYILASDTKSTYGFDQIIKQYAVNCPRITIEYKDIDLYPNFAYNYTEVDNTVVEGSVIVVCGDKSKYINYNNFVYTYDGDEEYTTTLELEPLLTAAINEVIDESKLKIYQVGNHGEESLSEDLATKIERDNYEVEVINLLSVDEVPEDAALVLINSPTNDYTEEDIAKLERYMLHNGKIYVTLDALSSELKNLNSFLLEYGIEVHDGILYERADDYYTIAKPTYLIPNIESHEITDPLINAGQTILSPVSKGLLATTTDNYEVTSLLNSSSEAFVKKNLHSDLYAVELDDEEGQFSIALLSESALNGQILVFGCNNALLESSDEYSGGGNTNFVVNGINYLVGDTSKISIRAKTIEEEYATYTYGEQVRYLVITCVVIPLVILIMGIIVVVMRKRK